MSSTVMATPSTRPTEPAFAERKHGWWARLPVAYKLGGGTVITILVMIITILICVERLQANANAFSAVLRTEVEVGLLADDLELHLEQQDSAVRGYVMTS